MTQQKRRIFPFLIQLIVGLILLVFFFAIAMVFGAADTTLKEVWLAITSQGKIDDTVTMIREIRLPREIGAIFIGAALSVAGAIMQGMTRNPLADPGLLGLTAGANAALAFAMALLPALNYFGIMFACFIGAAIGALLVFGISMLQRGGFSPLRLVLAGTAVSAFLYAIADGIGLFFKVSKDVSMWTSGGLVGTSFGQLQIVIPTILVGIFIAILLSRQLTVLSLSEEVAVGLGQNTLLVKMLLFIVIVVLVGTSVALVGNLAFIGLMVPHMVRAFVGTDYRHVIPMSAIFGASLMLLADTVGRTINAPYETPLAAIIAILGLPFFLVIVRKGGKAFS
ncbi:FecCD family ABC transporter permease [Rummeliibacillus pycnus]|uniref:FecCD family ABC transporter permease n=1 Tax=Rummeliibacillus pycnus TaxID=101070 RepID=UPI003D2D1D99